MTDTDREQPTLFEPESIAIATFLGSPLAGSVLWAMNERRVGRATNAVGALVAGAAALVFLLFVGSFIPSGAATGVNFGLIFGARHAARAWMERAKADGLVDQPLYESRWKAAGIGIVHLVAIFGLVIGGTILTEDPSVEVSPGVHIIYAGGATEAEARALGEELRALDFFDGHEMDIRYERIEGGHAVSLIVPPTFLIEPGVDAEFRTFRSQLQAGHTDLVELRLCDELWDVHQTYGAR